MYRSHLYYALRARHLNKVLTNYSWVVLVGLVCWAGWMFQVVNAIVFTLNRPVIIL